MFLCHLEYPPIPWHLFQYYSSEYAFAASLDWSFLNWEQLLISDKQHKIALIAVYNRGCMNGETDMEYSFFFSNLRIIPVQLSIIIHQQEIFVVEI